MAPEDLSQQVFIVWSVLLPVNDGQHQRWHIKPVAEVPSVRVKASFCPSQLSPSPNSLAYTLTLKPYPET